MEARKLNLKVTKAITIDLLEEKILKSFKEHGFNVEKLKNSYKATNADNENHTIVVLFLEGKDSLVDELSITYEEPETLEKAIPLMISVIIYVIAFVTILMVLFLPNYAIFKITIISIMLLLSLVAYPIIRIMSSAFLDNKFEDLSDVVTNKILKAIK